MVSEGYIYVLICMMVDICAASLQDSICHIERIKGHHITTKLPHLTSLISTKINR